MIYSLYVDRALDGSFDYHSWVLQGQGVVLDGVDRFTVPEDFNSRLASVKSYTGAINKVVSLMSTGVIPVGDLCVHIKTTNLYEYLVYEMEGTGIRAPKSYTLDIYDLMQALNKCPSNYILVRSEKSRPAKKLATATAFKERQKARMQRAVDVFSSIEEG